MSSNGRIEDLIQIPEKISRGISVITWESAESDFGNKFPKEFIKCIDLYGLGYFSGFLMLYSPIDIAPETNPLTVFADKLRYSRSDLKQFLLNYPEVLPKGDSPNADDLTLFGGTINGDQLYWLGNPESNGWSIYVFNRSLLSFSRYDLDIESFIIKITKGENTVGGFADDAFTSKAFEPVFSSQS